MKFSLSYKLISFSSVSVAMIMVVVIFNVFSELKQILEEQIKKDLTAIAEGTGGQIFIFFEKIKMQSRDWSSDGFIRQKTEELAKTGNQDIAEALREHLLKSKMSLDSLVVVADILDADMRTIASSDEKRVGVEEQEHAGGKSKEELMALKYGEAMISQVMIEQESEIAGGVHPEYPVFHSLAPIKSFDDETTIGFLLLHFSADNLNKIVGGLFQIEIGALSGQEFILNQKTAEMFLVNKDGYMITPSRFIKNSVLKNKIDNPATRACFDEKKEYRGSYVGYLGREIQVTSMCLVGYDVVLLAEIGTDEIFAPLIKERNRVFYIGGVIFLFNVLVIYLFSRLFLKNILAIRNIASQVALGNFSVRTRLKVKDEAGDLGRIFDNMLDNIEHSEEEMKKMNEKLRQTYLELEKSNIALEGKVKARTKELEDARAGLEARVYEKTIELQKQIDELERFKKVTLGRELRMIELKKELEELKKT